MARPRLDLDVILKTITPKVYFQPPPSVTMEYPCIVYERDSARAMHADNKPHAIFKRYQVTIIDRNPDSAIPDQVAKLPTANHVQWFAADGLNHDVYTLYF